MEFASKEQIIDEAKKYAIIFDDLALKSVTDYDRWIHRRAAKILRVMADRIKEQDGGEELERRG